MQKTFERIQAKSFDTPDETRTFEKGKVDLINFGGATVGRATFEPGWRWSQSLKSVMGTDLCEASHLGYILQGAITAKMEDGTEQTFRAGQAFSVAPRQDAWVQGSDRFVCLDFQGMSEYAKGR